MRKFAALAAVLGASAIAVGSVGAATKSKSRSDGGTVYVSATHQTHSGTLFVDGDGTDKVLGSIAITFQTKVLSSQNPQVLTVKANKVTIWASNGTLTGTGSAKLTVGSGGKATVSNGKINLTRGTGALKGHTLVGTFTGNGSVTSGTYTFHYTGTYM